MDYFSSIIGQDRPVEMLKKALKSGKVSHAYLFVGLEGVGKSTTAWALACSLLAEGDKSADFFLRQGMHPDLMVLKKADNKTVITKEQVSGEMEPWLALKPYRSRRRVVIIEECHLLSLEAANALLKTLEEPPGYGVLILISNETSLLETIVSRCQVIRFFPVAEHLVEQYLLQRGYEADKSRAAARLGQGSLAASLRAVEEPEWEASWEIAASIVRGLSSGEKGQIFAGAEQMNQAPELVVRIMETILRDICVYNETREERLLVIPENIELIQQVKGFEPSRLREAIIQAARLKRFYRRNVNPLLININIAWEVYQGLQRSV